MSDAFVKLTIVAPADLEASLIETLLEMTPPIGAFTALHVDGHGESFAAASTVEQVSGRASRLMLVAIVSPSHASAVIDALKAHLRIPHAVWWTAPVLEFGKFL